MSKLSDNLQEVHIDQRQYVKNWQDELPKGSLWTPGSKGDPACRVCMGTGWVRYDVYPGHPQFGKVAVCNCVANHDLHQRKVDYENSPDYVPVSKSQGRA
jgi:hypothetical protein